MLAQKLILNYSSRILIQITSMIVGIFVARIAGPTALGIVAFGMSFVSMFQFIADFGTGTAHVKLISEGRDIGTCISTFTRIKLLLTAVFFFFVVCAIFVQYAILHKSFETHEHFIVVLIWLASIVLTQISLIPISTFIGRTEQAKQDVPSFIQSIIVQILRLVAVIVGLGAIGLSGAQLLGAIILVVIYFQLYKNYPRGHYDHSLAMEYVKISIPIIIIGFASNLVLYLDRVILQYYSDARQVGYYAAGISLSGFVQTIGNTVGLLFFPMFSSAVARNDHEYIHDTIHRFERFTYIFIMPFVIFVVIYSEIIVRVFLGKQYVPSGPVLAVMVAGSFFYVTNMPYGNFILGMNKFRLGAWLQSMSLFLFIALNVFILKRIGIGYQALGTALAVSSNSLAVGYSFRFFAGRISPQLEVWKNERYLLYGFILTGIGITLKNYLHTDQSWTTSIVFAVCFFLLTYVLMFLMKWITKDDLRQLQKISDVKKIYTYIRTEL
ncbi:MAG: oligosaccharide flippase family protein [Bacteroidota bacterium]